MVNRIDCRDCSCSEQPHGFAILPGLRNRNRIARMIHLRSPVTVHDDFINLRSWPQVRSFSEFNCRRIRIGLVEKTMPTDWTFTVRDAMRGPIIIRPLLIGLIALSFGQSVSAGEPTRRPFLEADSDPVLAMNAKAALADDPLLAKLNLMVSVVDRVAVVGGPVPSQAHIKRIESILRDLDGLSARRVACWVAATKYDPLADRLAQELRPKEPSLENRTPPRPLTLSLPNPHEIRPDRRPSGNVTVNRVEPERSVSDFLLNPTLTDLPEISSRAKPVSPRTIPATNVPTQPREPSTLAQRITAIQQGDNRFARFQVTLKPDYLLITGSAEQASDSWVFAKALRQLPGIERIVVGNVSNRSR